MQPNSMELIRQAMARRGMVAGTPINVGTSMPAVTQVTSGGQTPMGTPSTVQPPQPSIPVGNIAGAPNVVQGGNAPSPVNSALLAGQKAQSSQFDPETRDLAKSLISRLLKAV